MSKAFRKTHYFLNPQNEVIVVENLKEFCKDNKFDYSSMKRSKPKIKGWTKYIFLDLE